MAVETNCRTFRPRWIALGAALPLALAICFVVTVAAQDLGRYDPAYFRPRHLEAYAHPGDVARALGGALRKGDKGLLSELQGLRRPAALKPSGGIRLSILLHKGNRYYTYLYFDDQTRGRRTYHVERVMGRWVVAPTDAHYYLHSGRWLTVLAPVAIAWWLVVAMVGLVQWLSEASARMRGRLYGFQD